MTDIDKNEEALKEKARAKREELKTQAMAGNGHDAEPEQPTPPPPKRTLDEGSQTGSPLSISTAAAAHTASITSRSYSGPNHLRQTAC
jgi:hypothetical protein